ncbi:MAG: hypothetical protein H2172_06450 [Opitutus sp.]|nr:hypothetical protein [Opitutus sp.]MCS6248476.1 hypothetical protein [Opitutus sp.]MCS6273562.1 hypothetical protein [Opitutus sp.]MCS6278572.1 hypothetical protein [Opitutus sp.]MCS6300026.1 hypothetical protein [Opitutus sp.]
MSFFAKITALLVLALWAPATWHCDLEAAGLLQDVSHTDSCCQTSNEPCGDETCRDFTRTTASPTPAPALYAANAWVNELRALLAKLEATALEPVGAQFSPGTTPASESLARTWSFVRRSALPARAPALVA